MSDEIATATAPAAEPMSLDKGKGKAVEEMGNGKAVHHDEEMDDDDEDDDDDDEEEEDEEDEDMGEPEDELDPSAIISAPRRRAQVDYSSKEALEKAGLTPEKLADDGEGDEFMAEDDE